MTIQEQHYDFKKKMNKIDSQQYKNLKVIEIDWVLREAEDIFIKMVAEPRKFNHLGFERNQRTRDDIRTIVVNESCSVVTNNIATLPVDYMFFLRGNVDMTKGPCAGVKGKVHVQQHDDSFEDSPFDRSSFGWREVNALFTEQGVKFYTDGPFTVDNFCLSYIRKPAYIHNASATANGQYMDLSGTLLTGSVNCELPEHTHREIVDIAVLITTGELQIPDYQVKQAKLKLNEIN